MDLSVAERPGNAAEPPGSPEEGLGYAEEALGKLEIDRQRGRGFRKLEVGLGKREIDSAT